jgi:hypothetical protein
MTYTRQALGKIQRENRSYRDVFSFQLKGWQWMGIHGIKNIMRRRSSWYESLRLGRRDDGKKSSWGTQRSIFHPDLSSGS